MRVGKVLRFNNSGRYEFASVGFGVPQARDIAVSLTCSGVSDRRCAISVIDGPAPLSAVRAAASAITYISDGVRELIAPLASPAAMVRMTTDARDGFATR